LKEERRQRKAEADRLMEDAEDAQRVYDAQVKLLDTRQAKQK